MKTPNTIGKQVPTPKRKRTLARVAGTLEHAVNASATKSGPGRYHKGGEPGSRISRQRPVRAYVALMAAWAAKRVVKWEGERDKHGAFTLVGRDAIYSDASGRPMRRIWLAGISAQRGY